MSEGMLCGLARLPVGAIGPNGHPTLASASKALNGRARALRTKMRIGPTSAVVWRPRNYASPRKTENMAFCLADSETQF
jgi:hypothetical protein